MENLQETYQPDQSYMRVAAARPEVSVANVGTNISAITQLYQEASKQHAALVTFPELSLTGYTVGDLVRQSSLLAQARVGLTQLAEVTEGSATAMVVGLPLQVGNALYNCAAVIADGNIKGIVPKQNLPTYGEFYEKRWYQAWQHEENTEVTIGGAPVPFGTNLLFNVGGAPVGIEICEDAWVTSTPSTRLAQHGALIIANPSASPELVNKANRRKRDFASLAGRLLVGYIYAGCDSSESTTDIVMGGHQMIYDGDHLAAEREPFSTDASRLIIADIDIDHLIHDRMKDTNYPNLLPLPTIQCTSKRPSFLPEPRIPADPFLPGGETPLQKAERLQSVFDIAAMGLAQQLLHSGTKNVVLGLSGGLDSTLALLIAYRASEFMNCKPEDMIHTITMPGLASSSRTQDNAQKLAHELGVTNTVISIEDIARRELELLQHQGTQDITYENVQARARTSILFNYANMHGCLVQGTGDLSEAALGWCTYNGDQQSSYNPNSSIPKTLVRHVVAYATDQEKFGSAKTTLEDILATPVSPELTRNENDTISQETESLIGPYVLHEFFLTQLVRYGDESAKVQFLAEQSFADTYSPQEITDWFAVFKRRFLTNQFKRTNAPGGPKIGSVSLGQRGDWRMPSDLPDADLWK